MSHRRNLFSGKKGRKRILPTWRMGKGPNANKKFNKEGFTFYDPLKKPDPDQIVKTNFEEDYKLTENKAYTYPPFAVVLIIFTALVVGLYFIF